MVVAHQSPLPSLSLRFHLAMAKLQAQASSLAHSRFVSVCGGRKEFLNSPSSGCAAFLLAYPARDAFFQGGEPRCNP